jgi:hypothetical protein
VKSPGTNFIRQLKSLSQNPLSISPFVNQCRRKPFRIKILGFFQLPPFIGNETFVEIFWLLVRLHR